jgi:pimeloyl-ACP methyl ester carboxylesterase
VGAIGKKIIKVLAFPLIDPVMGEVGEYFAGKWERAKRPYRIRDFSADNFATLEANTIDAAGWQRLAAGRALLMVHGTTSLTHTGFGTFSRDAVDRLNQLYEGRVFAFDHFTLSADPLENVAWFFEQLPAGISLDVDIVCHSRGGLVSRAFAEQQAAVGLSNRTFKVGRVVFVATPNAGTVLADPGHLGDLVDSYTNILNFYPGVGVVDAIEVIVTIVKQLAVGAAKGLPGLISMTPGGEFLAKMNSGPAIETKYFALAANFEPKDDGFKFFARDLLADRLFHADNDLIVPTEGVWDTNGGGQFPIADRLVFPASDGIQHSGFFANTVAQDRIIEWLKA